MTRISLCFVAALSLGCGDGLALVKAKTALDAAKSEYTAGGCDTTDEPTAHESTCDHLHEAINQTGIAFQLMNDLIRQLKGIVP